MKKIIATTFICLLSFVFVYSQKKSNQEEILITANGWGKVTLGESNKDVEKVLGKPEKLDPISDVIFADYYSEGIQISYLAKKKTVNAIFFYNNQRITFGKFEVFSSGQTDKGINWSSNYEDVLNLYGKPLEDYKSENSNSWRRVVYRGLDFRFENEKLVRISVFVETENK